MHVKFLKAGTGDSILIQHKGWNVVIDGGNDSRYLLDEINLIQAKKECIDLLIITHHDDDHIKGIIDLLNLVNEGRYGDKTKFIKKVIFNSPRLALGKVMPIKDRHLSYKQAHDVEDILIQLRPNWEIYTEASPEIVFEDLRIDFLSPTKDDITEYGENKGALLASDYKCDWKTPMNILEKYLDDDSQDTSLFNKSSIVIKVECEGKKILFTGDVTPKRFEKIIDDMAIANGGNPVEFDFIKLPHHGSYRSLNKGIIEKIRCTKYIISTNSKKYSLPNKRAILKVLKYLKRGKHETIDFIFNYQDAITNLNISTKELNDYNFTLEHNNRVYGYII